MPIYTVLPTKNPGDIPSAANWQTLVDDLQALYEGINGKTELTGGPYTTTGTSFGDIDAGLNLTLNNLSNQRVKVALTLTAQHATINLPIYFTVAVGGVNQGHATEGVLWLNQGQWNGEAFAVTLVYITNALTGNIAFAPRWRVSSGTGRVWDVRFSAAAISAMQ